MIAAQGDCPLALLAGVARTSAVRLVVGRPVGALAMLPVTPWQG